MLPFETDVERATQEPPRELTVAGLSPAQPWTLRLFAQGLRLTPQREGEPPIHVLRSEIATHVDLVNFGVTRRTLVVRKPKKRLFKLDPAAWAELKDWMGREARLRIALRQRLGYGIPIGILVIISSLPVPGDAAAGIEGVAFNPLFAALGALLVAGGILARRRPHPALFLLDSAWFAVLAGVLVVRVINGGSPLWLILAAMQLVLVWSGLGLFRELSVAPADRPRAGDAKGGAPP